MSNSYQRIKSHIFNNLKEQSDDLEENTIKSEILSVQKLISTIGLNVFAQFLADKSELTELSEQEWIRLKRELETEFDVKMEFGVLIQGNEQRLRDSTWWTGKYKQESENFYWNRYKSFISKSLPDDVVNTINIDTDIVMNNLEDPNLNYFNRYGMVVGHVQSGKTANYSALVCKAADAGYKFIVVVAGGMNNLRNQTQQRLNEYFVGQDQGVQVGAGIGNTRREKLPISLTTSEKDFNKQDADRNSQGLNFDNINVPILIVIKKNTRTLTNVTTWLQKQYTNIISDHSMLLIDDESDYASINTKEEEDPTTINKKLRELLSLFHKSVYVAYTATPYANIFIDHEVGHEKLGKDLFPKDFIYALEAPSNYFGARKVYLDSNNKYLVPINIEDYGEILPLSHKKDDPLNTLPKSLYDAVRVFILNVAIRHLSGQGDQHNSMMIHASRFTKKHQQIGHLVNIYLEKIKHELIAYGRLPDAVSLSKDIDDLKSTFENRYENIEFRWKQILDELMEVIESIVIREVHQKKTIPLEYRKDRPTNAIVVGGTSLSRGYTLEGLSVSYFLRKTIFYDTLMQMGRWFGYRTNYDHLCKIYMTKTMIKNFAQIIEATEDLIDDFHRMAKEEMTPEDFGLAVKYHPDSALQVTARNKLKNTQDMYLDMKLDGHAKETALLDKNPVFRKQNIKAIEHVITKVDRLNDDNDVVYEQVGKRHLWRNAPKKVVEEFLNEFKVFYTDPFGIKSRMPIDFIKKYVLNVNTLWDIALYNGKGDEYTIAGKTIKKEGRTLTDKGQAFELESRQVSSGSSESIVLSKDEQKQYGSNRKDIRAAMKKPLLMLHILETDEDSTLAAFGISFPGGVKSHDNTIKIKVNTVMTQLIETMIAEEKETDD